VWYILGGLLLGIAVVAIAYAWWAVVDEFKRSKKRWAAVDKLKRQQKR
jgi:hypothetical protein